MDTRCKRALRRGGAATAVTHGWLSTPVGVILHHVHYWHALSASSCTMFTTGMPCRRHPAPCSLLACFSTPVGVILHHVHYWHALSASSCTMFTTGMPCRRHPAPCSLLACFSTPVGVILHHVHYWHASLHID
ncbi:hypothetical protein BaRGS_00013934 [Batillaria attramentaria]|uniref:Uncharacterized protein n=1 Tax=Batillaria attramentaria TaxID=370345 RepID=A0ABD0L5T7_9CAEN